MRTTIVGLFDEEESARFLQKEIKKRGIKDRDIETLSWRRLSEDNDPWDIKHKGSSDADLDTSLAEHLQDWGVPDDDSHDFAKAVRQGGNIVLARSDNPQEVDEIADLMNKNEAIDLEQLRSMWSVERDRDQDTHYSNASTDVASAARLNKPSSRQGTGLQEAHEKLHIDKKRVATGTVRVHKRVEEEAVDEDITLRSDKIEIERRPIDPSEEVGDTEEIFRDETIEFTEYAEEPVVEKEVRLDDEYVAKRSVEEHEETVHDTLRKTVVEIEPLTQGLNPKDSFDSHESTFRQHFNDHFGDDGHYDDYSPAYRYGHAFGASDEYADQSFEQVEPDLRRSYESQYGDGSFRPYREVARYAFNSTQNRVG